MTTSSENLKNNVKNRERLLGTVKWFSATKGFGFITPHDPSVNDGKDVFVHYHFLVMRGFKSLRENDIVEFSIGKNEKGVVAKEVKIVNYAE